MFLTASAFAQNQGSGGPAQFKPGGSATAGLFVWANDATKPFVLQPSINQVNGRRASVTVSGYAFLATGCTTLIVGLYGIAGGVPASAATTIGTYSTLAIDSAQTLTTNHTYPFSINAVLEGDSTSGILQGYFTHEVNNVLNTPGALAHTLSGINFGYDATTPTPSQAGAPYTLVVGVTFGTAEATNYAVLTQFDFDS